MCIKKHTTHTSCHTSPGHLPDNEAVAVDVCHDVGLEVILIQGLVQHLWSHIPPGTHPCAQRDVHLISVTGRNGEIGIYIIKPGVISI